MKSESATPAAGEPLATKQRVDVLQQRIDDRFNALEARMGNRLGTVRNELLAAFRGELVTAVSLQARRLIIVTAIAVFGIGGLVVTLAEVI